MEQTVANLQQAVAELTRQLQEMGSVVQQQRGDLRAQSDAMDRVQAQRAEELARMVRLQDQLLERKTKTQFVDVKSIGKPSNFYSDIQKFNTWALKLGSFLESIQDGMKAALEHVQDQEVKIGDAGSFLELDMYFNKEGQEGGRHRGKATRHPAVHHGGTAV